MGNTHTSPATPVRSTHSSSSSKRSKKSHSSSKSSKTKSSSREETKNERLVRLHWCEATYNKDVPTILKFFPPTASVTFKGGAAAMSFPLFLETVKAIWESFPDQILMWDSIEEVRPGVVRVENFNSHATHTGKPYSFGPYPPIQAKGAIVKENPCHLLVKVKRGKVINFEIDAYHGDVVGPPGYYQQIGGDLSAVPKQ